MHDANAKPRDFNIYYLNLSKVYKGIVSEDFITSNTFTYFQEAGVRKERQTEEASKIIKSNTHDMISCHDGHYEEMDRASAGLERHSCPTGDLLRRQDARVTEIPCPSRVNEQRLRRCP